MHFFSEFDANGEARNADPEPGVFGSDVDPDLDV